MNNKKPTFQTNKRQFKESSATGRSYHNKDINKKERKTGSTHPSIIHTNLPDARKQGNVSVTIKSSKQQTIGKKTGPLSPRAPEKIRKNRAEEMKVYGENACLSLFTKRPESIVRVWTNVQTSHKVGDMFRYLAQHKKVYHVVDDKELALVSGSEHHGGICMLVKKPTPFMLTGYLAIPRQQDCLVVLHHCANSYNVGGLVRTCALFGVKGIVVDNMDSLNSSTVMRVADGGMEHLLALESTSFQQSIQQLRDAGYQLIQLSQQKQASPLNKIKFGSKVAFIISESDDVNGLTPQDSYINIPHNRSLAQGLNIVVATGILLSAWYNQ